MGPGLYGTKDALVKGVCDGLELNLVWWKVGLSCL